MKVVKVMTKAPSRSDARPTVAHIVVGVDHSDEAHAALRWAAAEAASRGVELWMTHAYAYPVFLAWHTVPMVLDPERWQRSADEMLHQMELEQLGSHPGLTVRRIAEPDLARDLLVDESEGAALLVIGRHRHHQVKESLSGSASQVIQHARCPVIIVHPEDAPGPFASAEQGRGARSAAGLHSTRS